MSPTCSPSHQPRALPTVAPTKPNSLTIRKAPVRDVREVILLLKTNYRLRCPAALESRDERETVSSEQMPFGQQTMKHRGRFIWGLILGGLLAIGCGPLGTPLTPLGRACHTNADCRTQELCLKEQGSCEGAGWCRERPTLSGAHCLLVR
jgi:hypothetical protein